jgi:hypothetical protein
MGEAQVQCLDVNLQKHNCAEKVMQANHGDYEKLGE